MIIYIPPRLRRDGRPQCRHLPREADQCL